MQNELRPPAFRLFEIAEHLIIHILLYIREINFFLDIIIHLC